MKKLFSILAILVCFVLAGSPAMASWVHSFSDAGGRAEASYSGVGFDCSLGGSNSIVYEPQVGSGAYDLGNMVLGYSYSSQEVASDAYFSGLHGSTEATGNTGQFSFTEGALQTEHGGGYFFANQETVASYTASDWGIIYSQSEGMAEVNGMTFGYVYQFEGQDSITTLGNALATGSGYAVAGCDYQNTNVIGSGHVELDVGHTQQMEEGVMFGSAGGTADYSFNVSGGHGASGGGTASVYAQVDTWESENGDYHAHSQSYSSSTSGLTTVNGQTGVSNYESSYSSTY